jgi:DNA-binding beta-propeller fold protein YncE
MKKRIIALLFVALVAALPSLAQYNSEFASSGAREDLRLGVQAYHRGRYSESLLLFEKALAFSPDEPLISYWLGRAYSKSGYGATALRVWEGLLARPDVPPFLRSKVETLRGQRDLDLELTDEPRYVEAARFEGRVGKTTYFLRPSALLPERDGSLLVVAHGSNEIVRIDPNGLIKQRERGGLTGFDRPFGIASLPSGERFVTEFNGDRVTRLGSGPALSFGGKGRGDGQLIGPQYAVCDEDGYLYVTDYGNSRVVKFDPDGKFVLSFGSKLDDFPGFTSPTGLAELNGTLYVADSFRKAIYEFDLSGNYVGTLASGELHAPEGLSFWRKDSALLVSDTDRVVSLDLESERVTQLYHSPDRKARFVDAVADYNGNLLACDFDSSAVLVLTEAPLLAAGYDVEIERIDSSAFPKVTVDVSVRDREGLPVVGLGLLNFHLTERIKTTTSTDERGKTVIKKTESIIPVKDLELTGSGSRPSPFKTVILGERSQSMEDYRDEARDALTDLYNGLAKAGAASVAFVGGGASPALEVGPSADLPALTRALLTQAPSAARPGKFDLALRLAATSLLPTSPRDSVVYIGTGAIDETSFTGTTLSELAAFLRSNGIRFFAVILGDASPSASLRYLSSETDGAIYAASRPRGLTDLAADIATGPCGRYRLSFTARADSGFGLGYLSLGAEAYLYKKSGKDELGYYAPLQ